jgi:molecular chaperone DnaJ
MAKRDYYETLGISKGSSDADIKKAFRSKARELHPDKNSGSAKAEAEKNPAESEAGDDNVNKDDGDIVDADFEDLDDQKK